MKYLAILIVVLFGCKETVTEYVPTPVVIDQNFVFNSTVDGGIYGGKLSVQRYGGIVSLSKNEINKLFPALPLYFDSTGQGLTPERLQKPDQIIWGAVGDPLVAGDPQYGITNPRNTLKAGESLFHYLRRDGITYPANTKAIYYTELFWIGDTSKIGLAKASPRLLQKLQ